MMVYACPAFWPCWPNQIFIRAGDNFENIKILQLFDSHIKSIKNKCLLKKLDSNSVFFFQFIFFKIVLKLAKTSVFDSWLDNWNDLNSINRDLYSFVNKWEMKPDLWYRYQRYKIMLSLKIFLWMSCSKFNRDQNNWDVQQIVLLYS